MKKLACRLEWTTRVEGGESYKVCAACGKTQADPPEPGRRGMKNLIGKIPLLLVGALLRTGGLTRSLGGILLAAKAATVLMPRRPSRGLNLPSALGVPRRGDVARQVLCCA